MFWFFGLVVVAFILYRLRQRKNRVTPWKRFNFFNKSVVWLTGARSGIGEALLYELVGSGASVIISSTSESGLQKVKAEVEAKFPGQKDRIHVLPLDLTDYKNLQSKVDEAVKVWGRIDMLINNAGLGIRASALETEMSTFERVMNVNFYGAVALTRAALPSILSSEKSGHQTRVVAISSVQGFIPVANRAAYACSKHAMQAYYEALSVELEPTHPNLRVQLMCPGYVNTPISANALRGDGSLYGITDSNIKNGYEPKYVAEEILAAMVQGKHVEIICDTKTKLGVLFKNLVPELVRKALIKKAEEDHLEDAKNK